MTPPANSVAPYWFRIGMPYFSSNAACSSGASGDVPARTAIRLDKSSFGTPASITILMPVGTRPA